jgi:hypothetical protein
MGAAATSPLRGSMINALYTSTSGGHHRVLASNFFGGRGALPYPRRRLLARPEARGLGHRSTPRRAHLRPSASSRTSTGPTPAPPRQPRVVPPGEDGHRGAQARLPPTGPSSLRASGGRRLVLVRSSARPCASTVEGSADIRGAAPSCRHPRSPTMCWDDTVRGSGCSAPATRVPPQHRGPGGDRPTASTFHSPPRPSCRVASDPFPDKHRCGPTRPHTAPRPGHRDARAHRVAAAPPGLVSAEFRGHVRRAA